MPSAVADNSRSSLWLTLGLLVAGLMYTGQARAEAGRVIFVSGETSLVRGIEMPLLKGTAIEPGDTLVTGADGRVQLLMADGDRIALQPNTRFTVEEFSGPSRVDPGTPVPEARPSSWRSIYNLAKGGFRSLTRSLGGRNESSYQVRTPVATLGVRGTDYSVWLVGPVDGKYSLQGFVSKGEIWIKGPDGTIFTVGEGESFIFDEKGFRKFETGDRALEDFDPGIGGHDGPVQPIEGTGPDGKTFDFTPGETPDFQEPPVRDETPPCTQCSIDAAP